MTTGNTRINQSSEIKLASSVALGPVRIGAGVSVSDFNTVLFEAIAFAASRRVRLTSAERQLRFLGIVTRNGGTLFPPPARGTLIARLRHSRRFLRVRVEQVLAHFLLRFQLLDQAHELLRVDKGRRRC